MMQFYTQQRQFYCGIDLHATCMFVCVLDDRGNILLHKNFLCKDANLFLQAIEPYKQGLVVGCESTFNWYWLADLLEEKNIEFILGHALYMKSIYIAKVKSDSIDSEKIARLIRGGTFPLAHAYPKEYRASRDLLRRRAYLVRRRAEALTHIQQIHHQHNQGVTTNIRYKSNRQGLGESLPSEHAKLMVSIDLEMIDAYTIQIKRIEDELVRSVKLTHFQSYYRLTTIPGVGAMISLTMIHEIETIQRFAGVGKFLSYCRLVKGSHSSAGKKLGAPGGKIGNPYLRWAFGEAIQLLKRESKEVLEYARRLEKKHGKARATNILAVKLGRSIYYMLRDDRAFDLNKFLQH
jgi:transposase